MTNSAISSLPDYAALRQVRDALWNKGSIRGAAVMVGSGFSRFANRSAETVPMPPLWNDFVHSMLAELYPHDDVTTSHDPLALAQEYRATLGQTALDNLIRDKVRDTEWSPGELHSLLLKLPWNDILTTNWDTLLERTVEQNPDMSYDIVRTTSDIARTSAPRITKLHGSLPSHGPFVFTEEEFRKYPIEFPAFVNLARQILLQNELCMLGFSGNDPNFIEWSGWVRDHLGSAARPIRLIGVLDLSHSRRRYFQDRNVTVIDLAPLVRDRVGDDRHYCATLVFLQFMNDGRPRPAEWKISNFADTSSGTPTKLNEDDIVRILQQERRAYPGWLVMPVSYRWQIRSEFSYALRALQNLDIDTSLVNNIPLAAEIVWRHQVSFDLLTNSLERQVYEIVSQDKDHELPLEDRLILRRALTQAARRNHDVASFEERVELLESLNSPVAVAEASYERCLIARKFQDYASMMLHIDKIDGDDPIWKVRRAALLSELGDSRLSVQLLYEAFRVIKLRRAQNPNSIWLLSREAWASWLLDAAGYELSKLGLEHKRDSVRSRYREAKADPWEEVHWQDAEIVKASKDRAAAFRTRVPSFDPGSYVVPGRKFYGAGAAFPDSELMWLSEVVGIPLRLGHTDLLASRFADATLCSHQGQHLRMWWILRCAVNGRLEAIKEEFSRSSVARLDVTLVRSMIERMTGAIEFMLRRVDDGYYDSSYRTWSNGPIIATDFVEILSFLSMRCETKEAFNLIRFGAALAHRYDNVSHNFFRNISALIARSLSAMKPCRKSEACLILLKLPLACEKELVAKETVDWTAALEVMDVEEWQQATRTSEWAGVIERLCRVVAEGNCEVSRRDAIHRLFEVSQADLLTEQEYNEYGRAIWRHVNEDGSPAACAFYPHIIRLLPDAARHNVDELFRNTVIAELVQGKMTEESLVSLHSASFDQHRKYRPFSLDVEDADTILENILQWRPRPRLHDPFADRSMEDRNIMMRMGPCLASTVLPCSSVVGSGREGVDGFLERVESLGQPHLICAAPAIASKDPEARDRATRVVQKGLISRDPDAINMALNAVLWFEEMSGQVPRELVNDILSICLMRREPGLLGALMCVQKFAEADIVPKGDIGRLVDALELMWAETDYENWVDETRSSDVGLLRKAVVKICMALRKGEVSEGFAETCIEEARADAMPEVRYAGYGVELK